MNDKSKKESWLMTLKKGMVVVLMGFTFFSVALSPAPAKATGLPTYDAGNFLQSAAEFIANVYTWIRENLLDTLTAVTFKNGISIFLNQLATQTAEWIASGDEGKKPLLFTDQWGDYLQEAGENAVASMVIDFADQAGLGNICAGPEAVLDIALSQLEPIEQGSINIGGSGGGAGAGGGKPKCSLDELSQSWDVKDTDFLSNFAESFRPSQNDLGIAVSFLTQTQAEEQRKTKEAEKEREGSGGFQNVEEGISGYITTPKSQVEAKMTETSSKTSDAVTQYTGDIVADALSAFASTLASQYLNKLQTGFFSLIGDALGEEDPLQKAKSTILSSLTDQSATSRPGGDAQFHNVFQTEIKQASDYSIIAELSLCPTEIKYASLLNCSIDSSFVQILQPSGSDGHLTVREAVNANLLHGDWSFGFTDPLSGTEPSYLNGYAYSNMKKLRKLRILPVGWEMAATQIRGLGNRVSLQQVLDGYEQAGSPFYHLVDPDWVIKAPEARCAAKTPSQILIAGGGDRVAECVDTQDCVAFGSSGECLSWGYCTHEKRQWDLPGQTCPEQFATCDLYLQDDSESKNNLWLGSTLDYTGCSIDTVGCSWYSTIKNSAGEWSDVNRIYLTAAAQTCKAADAGCNEYLSMSSGSNVLRNSGFEDDGGHNYVLSTGDQTADNGIPDGWSAQAATVQLVPDAIEGQSAVQLTSISGSECLHGIKYVAPLGSFEVGQTYTLSGRVKTDGTFDTDLQIDFQNIPLTVEGVGQSWRTFAFNLVMPATPNTYTLVLGSNDGSCTNSNSNMNVLYDAIQLERGVSATRYKNYGVGNQVYLQNAPACTFEDVGCREYIPENEDSGINATAIATGADVCPEECSEYSTYEQQATNLEVAKFDNFIANTAVQCTANEVGCEEFTNLDVVSLGGEGKEYYSRIKHCEKPQPQCDTYFAWEGSDTTGFQLTSYSLFADSISETGAAPYSTDGSTTCDPNDANCRELVDEFGNRYVRNLDLTVTCSTQCVPLRAPEGMVTQTECEGRLGRWDDIIERCIYQAISQESKVCQDKSVGCREYIGNTGLNIAVVLADNFEDADVLGWSNGNISTEATSVGGHSLKLGTSSLDIDEITDYFIADLEPGKYYTLDFSAKSSVSDFLTVTAWLGDDISEASRLGSFVSTNASWNQYSLGPVQLSNTSSTIVPLTIRVEGSSDKADVINLFIDNVVVKKIKDSVYVAKNTWQTPAVCDTDPPLQGGVAGRSMVGCQPYTIDDDPARQTYYLKSFTRLCSEEKVGCEAVIDTYNSTAPYREIFQEGDEAEVVVPEDSVTYLVNREEFACNSRVAGCSELGSPSLDLDNNITGYTSTYLINDPDQYASILCRAESLYCEEFQVSNGATVYAKHPKLQQCEYREVPNSFPVRYAWFRAGIIELDPEENPIECIQAKDNSYALRCPASQISCTQYHEPITGESYFYKKNTLINRDAECNGVVDWKQGCVVFDDLSVRDKYFRSGVDIDYIGAPDGCQTGDLDCNTNALLKVNLDRQCSQWLAPVTSARYWNDQLQKFKTTSFTLGRCLESDPVNPTICRRWNNSLDKPVLSIEEYKNRDVSWAGEDYTGYSIPNTYPIETLRQYNLAVDSDGLPSHYRLSHLDVPDDQQGCQTTSECPQVEGQRQACRLELDSGSGRFAGKCYLVKGVNIDEIPAESTCRGYPEKDSPFPESLAIYAPENDTDSPNQMISKHALFQNANIGAKDEEVECNYTKVRFQSETRYYNSDTIPPSSIVSDGEVVKFTSRDRFFGWEGYCLEHDPSRFINGSDSETACLTWYPVDVIQGAKDLSNSDLKAGYIVSDDSQFYCLQATFAEWLSPYKGCAACTSPFYTALPKNSGDGCSRPYPAPDMLGVSHRTFLGFDEEEIGIMMSFAFGMPVSGGGLPMGGFLDQAFSFAFNLALDITGLGEDRYPEVICMLAHGNGWYPKLYAQNFNSNDNIMCSVVAKVQSPGGRNKVSTTRILDEKYLVPDLEFPRFQQSLPFGSARTGTLNPEDLGSPLMLKNINDFAVNCDDCQSGVCQDEEANKLGKACPFTPNAGSPYAVFSFWPQLINDGNIRLRAGNRPLDDDRYHQPYPRHSIQGGAETAREGVQRLRNLFAKSYGVWSWQVGYKSLCVGTCLGGLNSEQFCDSHASCGDTDITVKGQEDLYICADPGDGLCVGGMYSSLSCTSNADCAFNPDDLKFKCIDTDPDDPTANSVKACSDGILKGEACEEDENCNPASVGDGLCDNTEKRCQAIDERVLSMSGKICASDVQCNTGTCEVSRCSTETEGTDSQLCIDLEPGDACGSSRGSNSYGQVTSFGWDTIEDAPDLVTRPVVQPVVQDPNSSTGLTEGFIAGGGFSINGFTSGTINAQDGRAPATVSFYAYNLDGEQMPLRVLIVDWGDGTDPAASRGSFKNHKHSCLKYCSNDTRIDCNKDIECQNSTEPDATCDPVNFGDSDDACVQDGEGVNGFFAFSHTYTCDGSDPCEFIPQVLVSDNWGATTQLAFPGSILIEPRIED